MTARRNLPSPEEGEELIIRHAVEQKEWPGEVLGLPDGRQVDQNGERKGGDLGKGKKQPGGGGCKGGQEVLLGGREGKRPKGRNGPEF